MARGRKAKDRSAWERSGPVIYVLSFSELLTKVGRSVRFTQRRRALTHNGTLEIIGEAAFLVDPHEDLFEVEDFVLREVSEKFPRAGGREFFRASFEDVLPIVQRGLVGFGCDFEAMKMESAEAERVSMLSDISGDQLDLAIKQFCRDHGVSAQKVVRWLDADKEFADIQRTGLISERLADRMKSLMERPSRLYT